MYHVFPKKASKEVIQQPEEHISDYNAVQKHEEYYLFF